MTIRPVIHHDADGDECIAWGWRKRYYNNASAILKSSQGYYKLDDDSDGAHGGWLAWRAPLEQDVESGALVFPQGTQPLTKDEAEKAQQAYEQRNWPLFRTINAKVENTTKKPCI